MLKEINIVLNKELEIINNEDKVFNKIIKVIKKLKQQKIYINMDHIDNMYTEKNDDIIYYKKYINKLKKIKKLFEEDNNNEINKLKIKEYIKNLNKYETKKNDFYKKFSKLVMKYQKKYNVSLVDISKKNKINKMNKFISIDGLNDKKNQKIQFKSKKFRESEVDNESLIKKQSENNLNNSKSISNNISMTEMSLSSNSYLKYSSKNNSKTSFKNLSKFKIESISNIKDKNDLKDINNEKSKDNLNLLKEEESKTSLDKDKFIEEVKNQTKKKIFKIKEMNMRKKLKINNKIINKNVYKRLLKHDSYENLDYSENNKCIKIKIYSINFFPNFIISNKVIFRLYNENNEIINNNSISLINKQDSTINKLIYNESIEFNIENNTNKNLLLFIYYLGFYNDQFITCEYPVLWGFSFIKLNIEKSLNKIKIGKFLLPIYLPYFLKLDFNNFYNMYKKDLLERYSISYLECNIGELEKNNLPKYYKIEFSDYEIILQNNLIESNNQFISDKFFYKKNFEKENIKIEKFLNLYNSSIIMNPRFADIIENKIQIDIEVPMIINKSKKNKMKFKVLIDYYEIDDYGKINITTIKFDNLMNIFSNNKIILFEDEIKSFNFVPTINDFLLIKVVPLNFDNKLHNIYGWNLFPLFYDEGTQILGNFIMPLVKNKLNNESLFALFGMNPKIFQKNLVKNSYNNKLILRKSFIFINLENHNFIHTKNKELPKLMPEKINNIFMPYNKNEFYKDIKKKFKNIYTDILLNNDKTKIDKYFYISLE